MTFPICHSVYPKQIAFPDRRTVKRNRITTLVETQSVETVSKIAGLLDYVVIDQPIRAIHLHFQHNHAKTI